MNSVRYLLGRLLGGALTILGVATVCFALLHALPGDPTDNILGETATAEDRVALRRLLRLDAPLSTQYLEFVRDLAVPSRGLGRSFRHPERTVRASIVEVWPDTVALALCAVALAWLFALPLALFSASRPRGRVDAVVGVGSLLGLAIPSLWLGPLLILLFCVRVPLLPFPGPDARGPAALFLPALSLGIGLAGALVRMGRASLREVLREPYILAAHARGVHPLGVLLRHALRTALLPLLTTGGAQLTALLGGAIVTEKIFDRRGLGTLLLSALTTRDLPVVLGCVVVLAATAVLLQLAIDLLYAVLDPRIRLG